MKKYIVIPSRFNSKRLPGKVPYFIEKL